MNFIDLRNYKISRARFHYFEIVNRHIHHYDTKLMEYSYFMCLQGIVSNVTLNGVNLTDWLHFPITMDDGITIKNRTENQTLTAVTSSHILPSVYVGSFMILEEPKDTYIDMSNWRKVGLICLGVFLHVPYSANTCIARVRCNYLLYLSCYS